MLVEDASVVKLQEMVDCTAKEPWILVLFAVNVPIIEAPTTPKVPPINPLLTVLRLPHHIVFATPNPPAKMVAPVDVDEESVTKVLVIIEETPKVPVIEVFVQLRDASEEVDETPKVPVIEVFVQLRDEREDVDETLNVPVIAVLLQLKADKFDEPVTFNVEFKITSP